MNLVVSPDPPSQRRRKLPKPKLQLRLVLGFLGVSVLAFSVQVLLLAQRLVFLSQDLTQGGEELSRAIPGLLTQVALVSLLVLLPSVLLIGVFMTFRIAGPVYRFERYFEALAAGGDPTPCKIRDGDELQELCQKINEGVQHLATRPAPGPDTVERREAA